ncbi:MAG: Fic family protein [Deltaproteobacteria bacterium]|nr:Fic family protein [Deltaproteobacteria bacterium]
MNKKNKYDADDPLFDQRRGVLKNKLGITDNEKLQDIEAQHLVEAYEQAALAYSERHVFAEQDIRYLHKLFLGQIYDWAGNYRSVDLSSEDIRYCHAAFITQNMQKFSDELSNMTPFQADFSKQEIVSRLAKIHGELIIIHPFRDGNGRTTRLLCDLLLMQAEYNPVDAEPFYNEEFIKKYHSAIQTLWHTNDHAPLFNLFEPMVSK